MIKKHEIILSFALSIVMVACIIIVGVVTFNRVEYEVRVCLENSSMESPVNCTLLNEQQHSGVVDGKEKWAWIDNNLGLIIFIIIMAVVIYLLLIGGIPP